MTKSLSESTSLRTTTVQLPSHCIATVTTGTNYAEERSRMETETFFGLRFDQAYPLKIKGIKEGEAFLGFELLLTGPDECEQLIKAFELAASQLRWQANLPLEEVPYTPDMEESKKHAQAALYDAELEVVKLMFSYGNFPVVGGPTVSRYLRSKLRKMPPVLTEEVWEQLLLALDQGIDPSIEWLAGQVGADNTELLVLKDDYVGEEPAGWRMDAAQTRQWCERAVNQYFRTALRCHQLELLQRVEEESNDEERQTLLNQVRVLENQQAHLAGL